MTPTHLPQLLACAGVLLLASTSQHALAQSGGCESPTEVQGFTTCADVEAAKKEGTVVLYAPSGQDLQLQLLDRFNELFPEIEVQSLWLQTGNLYSKVQQEVQTGNTLVDVLVLSDPTLLNDLQQSGALAQYKSPALHDYKDPNVKSNPEGYWTSWGMVATAIVYNEDTIGEDPPTGWQDLLDERYNGRVNLKNTSSGLQFAQWKTLSDLYGREYWTEGVAALNPVAFDSFTQQFDRVVSGTDLVAINGQISGAMQYIAKGAHLKIVYPEDGIPVTLEGVSVVESAPHPQAARLLIDYLLSQKGQTAIVDIMKYFSPRADVAPPEGSGAPEDVKFLVPNWSEMAEARPKFENDWQTVLEQ